MGAVETARAGLFEHEALFQGFGLQPTIRGPWASVGKTDRVQGWKLHISCVPGRARELLELLVPRLLALGVPSFKAARDEETLSRLNEGEYGGTQIGKFVTVYPASDEDVFALARELVALTQGWFGPVVATDLRLADVVYARYGGFNPVIHYDRLGQVHLHIHDREGKLTPDAYAIPFDPGMAPHNPFADWVCQLSEAEEPHAPYLLDGQATQLFGPGYLFLDVLRPHPKGSVYRAMDLRRQDSVALKVVKQGRRYCLADKQARDMRDRLKHQAAMHALLADIIPIPRADEYFESQGDGYLAVEWVDGISIEQHASRCLQGRALAVLTPEERRVLLSPYRELLAAVERLHAMGYVHRDLTASNIWVTPEQRIVLLDLELCHRLDDETPAFGAGTLGFMSPQQARREAPALADDLYALGAVAVLLLTGLDPRRLVVQGEKQLAAKLARLTGLKRCPAFETIAGLLDADAVKRPSLAALREAVAQLESVPAGIATAPEAMLEAACNGLFGVLVARDREGFWLSAPTEQGAAAADRLEYRVSANRGMAGILYLFAQLGHAGRCSAREAEAARALAARLVDCPDTPDATLPGLHFGMAGAALAVAEATAAGMLERSPEVDAFMTAWLRCDHFDWPDVTHGAAGQGIAALRCAEVLGETVWLETARAAADYLCASQQADGSWVMPEGVPGMSGETLTGFAHGVAGIAYFLLHAGRRCGDARAVEAARRAVEWLLGKARVPEDRPDLLVWEYSDRNPAIWNWWCHGGPGIALTLLAAFEDCREARLAEAARAALRVHPSAIRYANLSQCHGLAGMGEAYLEAARVLGDAEWTERAAAIETALDALAVRPLPDEAAWMVEYPGVFTGDLMVGGAGVAHFLLRLRSPGLTAPLLLGPLPAGAVGGK